MGKSAPEWCVGSSDLICRKFANSFKNLPGQFGNNIRTLRKQSLCPVFCFHFFSNPWSFKNRFPKAIRKHFLLEKRSILFMRSLIVICAVGKVKIIKNY